MRVVRALCRLAAIGASVAAGGYAVYLAAAWMRYGRIRQTRGDGHDLLLDRFMPTYDVVERHEIDVNAPAAVTFSASHDLDLQQSTLIAAIFKAREAILGGAADMTDRPRALVAWAKTLGWRTLADVPDREPVMGAVTRPWEANVVFRPVPSEQFAAFDEPNWVKIAWTLRVDSVSVDRSVARTETRAVATDATARRMFRRYWSLFSPGITLIRREALRLVKGDAERLARASARPSSVDRFEFVSAGDLDPQSERTL